MYKLLIKQFFSSRTTYLAFGLLFVLGVISIGIGKQFLDMQYENFTKVPQKQQKHIKNQLQNYPEDLGYLMYYVKFPFINSLDNLAGIAIGQRDLNTNIQDIGILNIESQRYDTDLVNPMRLQIGNLDLSFIIVFLFPLVIIALSFNLYSEEVEKGTWKMIKVQGKSPFGFLLSKLSVRFFFIVLSLLLLLFIAQQVLGITFDFRFVAIIILSIMYVVFWFALSLLVISFSKSSNFNAISLLTIWLVLVVLLPIATSKYVTNTYPIGEALSLTIKQRDAYHKKWDEDKGATMDKFYKVYPQFKEFGVIDKGFNWLWYYAMQHLGDEESKIERQIVFEKIEKRQKLSEKIANFLPTIKVQLLMNQFAKTDLNNYLDYLEATTKYHEKIRLAFYPKIFRKEIPSTVNWEAYKAEYFRGSVENKGYKRFLSIVLTTVILLIVSLLNLRKV